MDRKERAVRILFLVLFLSIVGICVAVLLSERSDRRVYFNQGMATAVALTTPFLFEIGRRLRVPPVTKAIMMIFIYVGMFLGSVNEWYYRFWWWDAMLHFTSGPAVGIAAYSIVLAARNRTPGDRGPSHEISLLLIFCFIMTIGTIWEIVEYTLDSVLGMNMQRDLDGGGLLDTMTDILLNTLGTIVFTLIAHHGLKGRVPILERLAIRPVKRIRQAVSTESAKSSEIKETVQ